MKERPLLVDLGTSWVYIGQMPEGKSESVVCDMLGISLMNRFRACVIESCYIGFRISFAGTKNTGQPLQKG